MSAKSKTLLWYGYESLDSQQRILECFKHWAKENKVEIWSFDVWLKSMDAHGCEINPGVPGCGLACAYLSNDSISVIKKYLEFVEGCYSNATYNGHEAALLTVMNKFS